MCTRIKVLLTIFTVLVSVQFFKVPEETKVILSAVVLAVGVSYWLSTLFFDEENSIDIEKDHTKNKGL